MKEATIKALKDLCTELMLSGHFPGRETEQRISNAADRLNRVLDEEQPDGMKEVKNE